MPKLNTPLTEKDHFLGPLDAPASLVIYGDYECPVCKMTWSILKQLKKELGDKLCMVFRHFPLKTTHPHALDAAKAAEAAGKQGKFWEMHDLLYTKQNTLHPQIWETLAQELNLNLDQFRTDFTSASIHEEIDKQFMSGVKSGVNGTPCFFINGERFDGDASYSNLKSCLTAAD